MFDRFCSACGTKLKRGFNTCSACGQRHKDASEEESIFGNIVVGILVLALLTYFWQYVVGFLGVAALLGGALYYYFVLRKKK